MRALATVPLLLALGCRDPQPVAPGSDVAPSSSTAGGAVGALAQAQAPSVRSCPVEPTEPEPLAVHSAVHVADLVGQRWFIGLEGRGPDEHAVLLHLDASGHVVSTPLPAFTEKVAVQPPHTMRFLVTADTPRWWTVDVSNPDAPVVGNVEAARGVPPGLYPKGFGADATRAVVALFEANPKKVEPFYIGRTALFEVPSGKRLSPDLAATAWAAQCSRGRCFALATSNDGGKGELVEIDGSGSHVVAALNRMGPSIRDGDTWFVFDCSSSGPAIIALGLGDGAVKRETLDVPAEACPSGRPSRLGDEPGAFWRIGRELWSVALVGRAPTLASTRTRVSSTEHGTQDVAPVSDGLVVVDFDNRGGMVHSPSDRAIRRYFHVWEFSGRVGFVRRGQSAQSDVHRLPHDGEEGKLSIGYDAHALSRGAHATAMVVGDRSMALRVREPCRQTR